MATDKTRSVSSRVPVEVADGLEADAEELGVKPGTLLRTILEKRYASPTTVRKSVSPARNKDDDRPLSEVLPE